MKTKQVNIRHVGFYLLLWLLLAIVLSMTSCNKSTHRFEDSPIDSVKVQSIIYDQPTCAYLNQTDYSMHVAKVKYMAEVYDFIIYSNDKIIDNLAKLCLKKYGKVSDELLYEEYINYNNYISSHIDELSESIYHKQKMKDTVKNRNDSEEKDTIVGINIVKQSNTKTTDNNGTNNNNLHR